MIVKVTSYRRKGRIVRGHSRRQLEHRGKFQSPEQDNVQRTFWKKGHPQNRSWFNGRKRVQGRGDGTSILRENKGRILGRTPTRRVT